ncbi:polyketide cyclase [Williamsia sterculiae]|uniref:polyketide cyclase n=1 Tax=Williamsia sterculiae TaxID=1344003 RepID=UPI001F1FAF42|nr:polyketide cyclase [Williamsia sterculiae]
MTHDEIFMHYPCDDLVSDPDIEAWRGVSVAARPERVWPWVAQIRLAPYSYDWIDNFGRRSPRVLRGLPEPAVGDSFTASGGRPLGRIVAVEPGVQLTATILGVLMSYVVVPDGSSTRLLLKVVAERGRLCARPLILGDLVMARRQLLNLKRFAEE